MNSLFEGVVFNLEEKKGTEQKEERVKTIQKLSRHQFSSEAVEEQLSLYKHMGL